MKKNHFSGPGGVRTHAISDLKWAVSGQTTVFLNKNTTLHPALPLTAFHVVLQILFYRGV
jgi:hypothetical protein